MPKSIFKRYGKQILLERFKIFILFPILFSSASAYPQLKLTDFDILPLGSNFNTYRDIKPFFLKKPAFAKGELKDSYQILYNNVSFDKYGSADYTFQYVNNILSSVEIEFSFKADEIAEFEYFIKTFYTDLSSDPGKGRIKESSNLNIMEAIKYAKRECKGVEGPDTANRFRNIPSKSFGLDAWVLKNSQIKDGRFFLVWARLGQTDGHWFDSENKAQEYHGGKMVVTISLTNEKLQDLRNWFITQDKQGFEGFSEQKKTLKLKESDGVYKVSVNINNTLTLDFVVDLGASDVSLSSDVYSILYKAGMIHESDIIGTQTYKLADGSLVKSNIINLRSLVIGDIKLENIRASVSNSSDAPLLLGQSALKQLGKYSIDNINKLLIIEYRMK